MRLSASNVGCRAFLLWIAVCVAAGEAVAARPPRILIAAESFDRGNVRISRPGESYADLYACIWNAGQLPNQSQYDVDFPVTADYAIAALYAAADSRPVDIYLDGEKVQRGFTAVTGSWSTSSAGWEKQCTARITKGRHTIKLLCPGPCMPHICGLVFESSVPFPEDWRPQRKVDPRLQQSLQQARDRGLEFAPLRRAIEDLCRTYGEEYPGGPAWLKRLEKLEAEVRSLPEPTGFSDATDDPRLGKAAEQFRALRRQALLANPLLDFDRLLLVRRQGHLGLPQNWQGNCVLPTAGFDNQIAVLKPLRPDGKLTTLYRPDGPHFVGDVDLHFDAGRMLFSSIGADGCWHVFEISADGSGRRQLTPNLKDVHHYDACYLPDGGIVFSSTAFMASVSCVNGSTRVANLYRMQSDGSGIRQLCFDQEHNWCPTVLEDGRLMYLRWEYTDTPHSHDRVLFCMNPDGTGQMEFYGSNSYWPNSLFYARPIPGRATMFAGIVSGHHGVARMGELVLFDSARGRREAAGAIQRIPGYGRKVESTSDARYRSSLIADQLVDGCWPKFLHPWPLGEKHFLVSCKPTPTSPWGIYLVDVFDNVLLLKEEPGWALLEPVPFRRRPTPPVIPQKIDLKRKDAVVYLSDVYRGGGLKGVPRGTVKRLRLLSYHYAYPDMGGPQGVVGMEGPWDVKRIVGTVPVASDGSAVLRVPANTPLAVQPLDAEGKALQLMRSWFTAMPGEVLSCTGCHEGQNTGPPVRRTIAAGRPPSEITPWHGPTRGFSFAREVQPVLDKHCVGCHHGRPRPDGTQIADLRGDRRITDYTSIYHHGGRDAGHFSVSYAELHRWVRRPGLESDYHLLTPMEFHADTTQLVQLLRKGHYSVRLDAEDWDRLITWIDLNAPFHGTWLEIAGKQRVEPPARRRRELMGLYANLDVDFEAGANRPRQDVEPVVTEPIVPGPISDSSPTSVECPGWPFDQREAQRRQAAAGDTRLTVDLGEGVEMELVLIPAGEFVMGDDGYPDQRPMGRVRIQQPFWLGRLEVTNRQYARFDPAHDSGVESRFGMQFGVRGFYVNGPDQPVVRVAWRRAMAFCRWLSGRTGRQFTLPSESQWEYACRAGTASPLCFGDADADFSAFANLADVRLSEFVCHPYMKHRAPLAASKYDDWIPKDPRFDDGGFLSDGVGKYRPNAWGLHDLHGNVWEWTRSAYRPYPYREDDGRNRIDSPESRVVRGGSWRDRPCRAQSAFRLAYRPYQPVYNVGFRVVAGVEKPQRPRPVLTSRDLRTRR